MAGRVEKLHIFPMTPFKSVAVRRSSSIVRTVALTACGLVAAFPGEARVRSIKLSELIRGSDYIVLARVDRVLTIDGLKVAKAVSRQALKGPPNGKAFYFIADRTWTCDISAAETGETALLFLVRARSDRIERRMIRMPTAHVTLKPLFHIADSGRGRMPLRTVNGQTYVTLWTDDVELPARITTIAGPERYTFIRSALLSDICDMIQVQVGRRAAGSRGEITP
jgi:hypothetical protein